VPRKDKKKKHSLKEQNTSWIKWVIGAVIIIALIYLIYLHFWCILGICAIIYLLLNPHKIGKGLRYIFMFVGIGFSLWAGYRYYKYRSSDFRFDEKNRAIANHPYLFTQVADENINILPVENGRIILTFRKKNSSVITMQQFVTKSAEGLSVKKDPQYNSDLEGGADYTVTVDQTCDVWVSR